MARGARRNFFELIFKMISNRRILHPQVSYYMIFSNTSIQWNHWTNTTLNSRPELFLKNKRSVKFFFSPLSYYRKLHQECFLPNSQKPSEDQCPGILLLTPKRCVPMEQSIHRRIFPSKKMKFTHSRKACKTAFRR